jgi:Polyketide cyclase / dehydrase and lipid transport
MVVEIPIEAEIRGRAEGIFDVITDLHGQDRWLARSAAFKGTFDVSDNPVRLGSTYREPTPQGVRSGKVTEFDRPAKITFHQPMSLRPFGRIDIVQRYTLDPLGETTRVRRAAMLGIPPYLRPLARIVVRITTRESGRTLAALKTYCEALPRSRTP